ncbi:retrotransposon ORF1, partial [Tanacetum coccineum]
EDQSEKEEIDWIDSEEDDEKKDDTDGDKSIDLEMTDDEETDDEVLQGEEQVNDDEDEEMKNVDVEYSRKGDADTFDVAKEDSPSVLRIPVSVIFEPSVLKPVQESPSVTPITSLSPLSISTIPPVPQQTTTPILSPPITTDAPTIIIVVPESDALTVVQLRVVKIEKDLSELKNINHSVEALSTLKSQVITVVVNYLGSKFGDTPIVDLEQDFEKSPSEIRKIKREQAEKQKMSQYTIKSTNNAALKEFDQKSALYQTMHANKSFNINPANHRLYHALMKALIEDENSMDKGVANTEDNVEPGVIFGRSFMRLVNGIVDFGNGMINVYLEQDPFEDDYEKTEKKEVRPVLETMAYNDKYKKVLDEIWKDRVELDGMITEEEEEVIKKVKGDALKEKDDPGAFIFPIRLEGKVNENALADTGSDINTMPYRIYKKLGREEIKKVNRGITMINHTQVKPMGILTSVLCQVGVTTLIAKFLILDIPIDRDAPIVVGRGFLYTIGGIVNTPERLFSTFDGICHQTFRAARSDVLRTTESDSDDEEEYEIKRNKFGAPMYGPKLAAYLNCNDPAERSLALQAVINPFWKISVWKKAVSFLGSLPVPLQHVDWKPDYKGCYTNEEEAKGQWRTEIRLTDPYGNIYVQAFTTKKTSRKLSKYHKMGYDGEINDMSRIKLREAGSSEEIFTSVAWIRAFNIKEPIYLELCHDLTLLEFARRLGLYHADELDEEGFDVYFQGGMRNDEHFNAQEYWLSISREDNLSLSRSHTSTIRNPVLRVVHKMIIYGLCKRTTGYDKIQKNDLWLLSMFDAGHQNGYANVAWLKGADLDTTTLREFIDSEGKLIHEDPQPGIQRVAIPRPLRASMQDLYDRMSSMEIRFQVVITLEWGSEQECEYSEEDQSEKEEIDWIDSEEDDEKKDDTDGDKSIDLEMTDDEETDDEVLQGEEQVNDDEDEEMKNVDVEYSRKGDADTFDVAKEDSPSVLKVPVSVIFEPSVLTPVQESPSVTPVTTLPPPSISTIPPVPHQTTTPILSPPITTDAPTITIDVPESDALSVVQVRVEKLEKDVSELKKIDHSTKALVTLKSQFQHVIDNYLGSKLSDALQKELQKHTTDLIQKHSVKPTPELTKIQTPTVDLEQESEKSPSEIRKIKREQAEKQKMSKYTIKSTNKAALKEYDQKSALYQTMHENKSFNRNPANHRLYHALMK